MENSSNRCSAENFQIKRRRREIIRGRRRQRGGGRDAGGREKKEGMSRGEKKSNDSTAENTLFVKYAYSSLKSKIKM